MDQDYSKSLVKEYQYWSVYVHENQGYVGRCVVWCKRENALDLTDATKEEREELFVILKTLQETLRACFHADWFNYAFLGNGTKHLHGHVIPRYAKPVEFMGLTFEDKHFGHNYRTDHDFVTSEQLLQEVRSKIFACLPAGEREW